EPNYENSTAAAKGCYWNERPFSNENERNTHNSTLPDINLLSTKNGLDFGVHLSVPLIAACAKPFVTLAGRPAGTAARVSAKFVSVTVSSNEAQHILI
ncbi:MAG: hypothetical protein WB991_13760, partial [Candidatus Sulfotelmatobacter sp.]